MDAPEVPAQTAQQITTELLSLPDDVLKYIAQFVPSLNDLAHASQRLDVAAENVDDQRWRDYLGSVAGSLKLADLPDVEYSVTTSFDDINVDAITAWIKAADEYVAGLDSQGLADLGFLPTDVQDTARTVSATITEGLQGKIGNFIAVAAEINYAIPQETTDALRRLGARYTIQQYFS